MKRSSKAVANPKEGVGACHWHGATLCPPRLMTGIRVTAPRVHRCPAWKQAGVAAGDAIAYEPELDRWAPHGGVGGATDRALRHVLTQQAVHEGVTPRSAATIDEGRACKAG